MNIRHAPNCKGEDVHEVTGRFGDLLARCNGCGWFVVLDGTEPPAEPVSRPRRAPVRLVCREHHGEPVTANGKGCRPCANDHAQRVAARKRRKGKPETTE